MAIKRDVVLQLLVSERIKFRGSIKHIIRILEAAKFLYRSKLPSS
jgi:hypothetical protein